MLLGRNGGNLRWCYRGGNTGDEDNLAACDVRRMRDALRARGYDKVRVVADDANEGEIINQLKDETRYCASGDSFVFYFSGHTRLWRGKMQLVLGREGDDVDTLTADTLIEKLEACPASAKLIILDCCYAGEATGGWKPDIYENLRILASTDRATPAGEFDELEGGVFTYFLYQALTDAKHWVRDGSGVVDGDGVIWSDALSRWLKEQVRSYAASKQRQVGEPLEYVGSDKQRVAIARVAPPDWRSVFRVAELNTHLATANIPREQVRQLFQDLLDKIHPAHPAPPPAPSAPVQHLAEYLGDMGLRKANVPFALAEFVHLLADEAPESGEQLRRWIDQVTGELERRGALSSQQRTKIGSSRRIEAPGSRALSLMVVPGQPDEVENTFANAGAWLQTAGRATDCVAAEDRDIGVADIPGLIAEALADDRVTSRLLQGQSGAHLSLEIFLPRRLLEQDVDAWTPSESDPDVPVPPLSYHYNLTVRPWERVAPEGQRRWTEGWEQNWGLCDGCRSRAANDAACVASLQDPVLDYGSRLNRGECLFILQTPPRTRADIVRPLTCGVAKLLWCDAPVSADLTARLHQAMAGRPLSEFPDIVREVRVSTWEASGEQHTGHLHLLWDDPARKPPIWNDPGTKPASDEPAAPLVSAFDKFST